MPAALRSRGAAAKSSKKSASPRPPPSPPPPATSDDEGTEEELEVEAMDVEEEEEEEEEAARGAGGEGQEVGLKGPLRKAMGNAEEIIKIVKLHKNKQGGMDLELLLSSLAVEEVGRLWDSWHPFVVQVSLAILQRRSQADEEVEEGRGASLLPSLLVLCRIVVGLPIWKAHSPPNSLTQSVILLHNVLPSVKERRGEEGLQNDISLLCEAWFARDLGERETIAGNALTFLLRRSLSTKGTKADVKRVWNLHQALLCFRLQDPSSNSLKRLLLEAAKSPLFIKYPDGVKFVVFLFSLSMPLVDEIHESIKKVLPGSSMPTACAYADIYFKVWRQSGGSFREKVEDACLQDFMLHGVLANRSLPRNRDLFYPIYHILDRFHSAKNDRPCQATLCRLWGPILWRHLKVANPVARANAAELFFSAFPVENPDGPIEEKGEQQEHQYQVILTRPIQDKNIFVELFFFQLMLNLLVDECADVRVTAIHGICRIIAVFWLIVPLDVLNKAMNLLLRELAFDASSPKVRLSVVKGMKLMLSCERSHIFLRKALPRIADCLHDCNETVRMAMVDLLVDVKGIAAVQYWDVCPLENLLARLEVDKPSISQKIVKLLFNSFFPVDQAEPLKIERCIYLIKANRLASRKFYEHCEKMIALHDLVKFMLAILVQIKRFVRTQLTNQTNDDGNASASEVSDLEDKENEDGKKRKMTTTRKRKLYNSDSSIADEGTVVLAESETASTSSVLSITNSTVLSDKDRGAESVGEPDLTASLAEPGVVAGLLDIVCIFWVFRSKEISKPESTEYRSLLEKKSAKILTLLFKYYKSSEVVGPVIYLCSLLPHSSVATVAGFCLSRLKSLEIPDDWANCDASNIPHLPNYADALCNWGRGDDLVEAITEWIQEDTGSRPEAGKTNRRSQRKGVRFAEPVDVPPRPNLALALGRYLLLHPINRAILLKKNRAQLEDLRDALVSYLPLMTQYSSGEHSDDDDDDEMAKRLPAAWDLLLKLTVLLHQGKEFEEETITRVEDLIKWIEDEVLSKKDITPLGMTLAKALTLVCSNMVTIGICDVNFIGHCTELSTSLISKGDCSLDTLFLSCLICHETASWAEAHISDEVIPVYGMAVPTLFGRILLGLNEIHKGIGGNEKEIALKKELKDFMPRMQAILDLYRFSFAKLDERPFFEVLQALKLLILSILATDISRSQVIEDYSSEISPILSMMLGLVKSKKTLMTCFLEEVALSLKETKDDDVTQFASVLSLVQILGKDSSSHASKLSLKEVVCMAESRLEQMSLEARNGDGTEDEHGTKDEDLLQSCKDTLTKIKTDLGMMVA